MNHLLFTSESTYEHVILIKESSFSLNALRQYYANYLATKGVNTKSLFAVSLPYNENGKITAAEAKENLNELLTVLQSLKTKTIYCADSSYFKYLTGKKAVTAGTEYSVSIKGFEHLKAIYGVNYSTLMYNPTQEVKMNLTLDAYASLVTTGSFLHSGSGIIHSAQYPKTQTEIKQCLKSYLSEPKLVIDIEAFSLSFFDAGIGSISFAKNKNEGFGFLVDYTPISVGKVFGEQGNNHWLKELLRNFFEAYKGKLVAHNANYDFKVLIYELWMEHPLDRKGMLKGIEVLTRCFDDTIIIAYLAANTTAEISFSLKDLGQSFAGDYAQEDIKDIRRIHPDELLKYNLTDCLTTFYVLEQYEAKMIAENQQEIYETLFKPSIKLILQMELMGMPMKDSTIQEVKKELKNIEDTQMEVLNTSHIVEIATHLIQQDKADKANLKLKKLRKSVENFSHINFSPDSNQNMQILLHDVMRLPILEKTATGQPATGKDVLSMLINHTDNPDFIRVIDALIGLSKVSKIITTFIPAFEGGKIKADGMRYLHGSFKLGGAVSGRMSSNNP